MPQTNSTAIYLDSYPDRSHLDAPLNQLTESDEFTAMDLSGLDSDTMASPPTQTLSTTAPATPFGPCIYPGHDKVISRKGDWVRHMDKYHKPGSSAWRCNVPNCGHVSETEDLFRQHHSNAHRCRKCMHADECRIDAEAKLVFACGFTGCLLLFKTWNSFRDHVKEHIAAGTSVASWHYSTELRNLLRRGEIAALWDAYCRQQLGAEHGYLHIFHWQPETSAHFKRELEYGDLREQLPQLVIRIFLAADSVRSRVASTFTSNCDTSQISVTAHNNSFRQPPSASHQELSSLDVAAYAVACGWDTNANAPTFGFANSQNGNADWMDVSYVDTSNLQTDPGNQSWLDAAPAEDPASFYGPFPTASQAPKMYFPNGVPQDPLAAFGFPEDIASMRISATKTMDSQHSRTKSSSSTSITKKLSSIFRKPTHSRSDSDNSDHRSVSMQMIV